MLRMTLLSLSALIVCIIILGCKAHSVETTKTDKVSAIETFMTARN